MNNNENHEKEHNSKNDENHHHHKEHQKHEHHEKKHVHHKEQKNNDSLNNNLFIYASIFLGILLILSIATNGFSNMNFNLNRSEKVNLVEGAVDLDFYVMSKCVYGTQAVNAIAPVLKQLEGNVNFNMNYIVTETSTGNFDSLFGQDGVKGDIVQLCAIKYEPEKYMDLVVCMNRNFQTIPNNWESCANELNLDVNKIKSCYEGNEGKDLLSESAKESNTAGATGSPTIYLDGKAYNGGRSERDFLRAICNLLETKPDACTQIPEEPQVNLLVLSDDRCSECDLTAESVIGQLNSLFPKLNIDYLNYNTNEGKEFYNNFDNQFLPLLLFDETVTNSEGYSMIGQYFEPLNDYYSLRIGANFDPTKEICDNNIDDTGNGLIDCNDPDCKNTLECNPNAFVECAADFDVSADSIVYYYSDTCPWCNMMKPGIEQLEDEGYNFVWSDSTSAEDNIMINQCFNNYMGGGVPQFICLNKNEIKTGAFATSNQELDLNAMKAWVDNCLA
jgi:hypothetical protein